MSTRKIKIQNVKHVKNLEFDLPGKGVFVLAGANGSGKTTLLACLYRIGHKNSFAENFRTTGIHRGMDSFDNASITYTFDEESVAYRYRAQRWNPSPKINSELLSRFGFPAVRFIAANAKRIDPTPEELKLNNIRNVPQEISDAVKSILGSSKYDNLKVINSRGGRGIKANLIQVGSGRRTAYYSEKNFSLGEFCIIKLVNILVDIPDNSLVLIDEIEMALYPKAQIRLMDYLNRIAGQKQLTVIFSTHSATLIKGSRRKNILYLKGDGAGNIECRRGCYPAEVLGEIAFQDDIPPDYVLLVEDINAKYLLEEMVEAYRRSLTASVNFPRIKIVAVGPISSVIDLLTQSDSVFGGVVKKHAFLDQDFFTNTLPEWRQSNNHALLAAYQACSNRISSLPCAPEQGIIDLIAADIFTHSEAISRYSEGRFRDIDRIISSSEYQAIQDAGRPRKAAKKRLDIILSETARLVGTSEESGKKDLFRYYVQNASATQAPALNSLFGPIFNPA
jgi:ABC-type lipoprotein export system ATPase subunit